MKTKILASLMVIGMVGLVAVAGTLAYFSDTEASTGNVFAAGELDLKIDWNESYNGELIETQPLTDNPGPIFELFDVKPGDEGEATISFHIFDNPAWVWMRGEMTMDAENGKSEPETQETDANPNPKGPDYPFNGELGYNTNVTLWYDEDCDNMLDEEALEQPVCIELVLDTSGSMDGDKLDETKLAAKGLVDYIAGLEGETNDTSPHEMSLEYFNTTAGTVVSLTDDADALKNGIDGLSASGWTDMSGGIDAAASDLEACGNDEKIVVLLSNGEDTTGDDPVAAAQAAYDDGYVTRFFTIGVDVSGQGQTNLEQIAAVGGGGAYYDVDNASGIQDAFDEIIGALGISEVVIDEGYLAEVMANLEDGMQLDSTPLDDESITEFVNSTTYCIGFEWWIPGEVGNEIQTDSVKFDMEFYTEQIRNNEAPANPWVTNDE
ncbi:MAG: TasA family protein [Candidatus Aenigmatarchaeota archaeon]